MNFAMSLLAALLLAISVQSRGRPGTDPNKAFSCTSNPQCPTGVCIAKTGLNAHDTILAMQAPVGHCGFDVHEYALLAGQ
ncbi:hypothetical protein PGTUg99_015438 [Puccinia graminis f. sp. tritici]|uniref:Uncharacterized protein n=1 Tax=Puccinia graminis f. sp. tritici TaxID=56615 RepID=A0A5B0SE67_PUCGR|nr:hypothetical protein PGTUg99_015438 [Puccinia graminis f. sp. tritici]